ncbi:serine dehydrogenase proteinase [Thermodesulfitimonas autotrophica]|uniref:Serine dehydrogenase proteinase n=1 Tax=Thermodesulfitimonas autotrophica TaxID=1894989 RepID=A0A3N5APK2_9THEO|nr:hypothetical protein [Thermodesulfitimonas autotrophica]RPF46883.1 serine dehydrogenase proteinase [Thermodesulfitimonas autotrophica]
MPYLERREIIAEIGKLHNAAVICYFTGDRENVSTRIAPDVLPVLYRHLRSLRNPERVALFLYTRGGDVLTPWRLVHLIREFAPYFDVLIPFRAYSAGTLVCLGADQIVMTKMGELGPIDPSVVNAFNPQDPHNPSARIPVNVEDVYSYLALAREQGGITSEEHLARAFLLLAERIHPLALGNVHRNYLLVRSLARRLLELRREPFPEERVRHIIDSLTEKLYAHNHMISRQEALREIMLPVIFPSERLEALMWELYEDFVAELVMTEPFNPAKILRGSRTEFEVTGGFVESEGGQDAFVFTGVVERRDFPEAGQISVNILKQGWHSRI